MTDRRRRARLLAECDVFGYVLPYDPMDRSACKAMAKSGALKPNACLGYMRTEPVKLSGADLVLAWMLIGQRFSARRIDDGFHLELTDVQGAETAVVHSSDLDHHPGLAVAIRSALGERQDLEREP